MARGRSDPSTALRLLGAVALLGVGAVHIEQYLAVHYDVIPVIGTLFVLTGVGAGAIAVGLILPTHRLLGTAVAGVVALAGITLAATAAVFLLVSEHTILFGFKENGYRTAIVLALIAEGATVALLGAYLRSLTRRRPAPARREPS